MTHIANIGGGGSNKDASSEIDLCSICHLTPLKDKHASLNSNCRDWLDQCSGGETGVTHMLRVDKVDISHSDRGVDSLQVRTKYEG